MLWWLQPLGYQPVCLPSSIWTPLALPWMTLRDLQGLWVWFRSLQWPAAYLDQLLREWARWVNLSLTVNQNQLLENLAVGFLLPHLSWFGKLGLVWSLECNKSWILNFCFGWHVCCSPGLIALSMPPLQAWPAAAFCFVQTHTLPNNMQIPTNDGGGVLARAQLFCFLAEQEWIIWESFISAGGGVCAASNDKWVSCSDA